MKDDRQIERHAHRRIAALLAEAGFVSRYRPCGVIYRTPEGEYSTVVLTQYNSAGSRIIGCAMPIAEDVWRWHVDDFQIRRPWTSHMVRPRGPKLEVSITTREVDAFAVWIPLWIRDRNVPPPLPMDRPGPLRDYAWSQAANEVYVSARGKA